MRLLTFPRRCASAVLVLALVLAAAHRHAPGALASPQQPSTSAAPVNNPVLPGDHPDPTVRRIGDAFWMTSTSGGWAPVFSLYRSTDLRHWSAAGAVFPNPPSWARGDFWAPELYSNDRGVFVFYAARKKAGPLCVAVATAPQPEGPYTDHGPLICQPDGSIDPAVALDEHNHPFLLWKEDGNSINKPTILWAQRLSRDLLHLKSKPVELMRNDPATWEANVIEGPYVLRHDGHFFLFYAGSSCCGSGCHYAEGVARADHLLGPWTRDPDNPIIRPNGAWRCPGHGTAVTAPDGRDFLLYHAYPVASTIFVGRQSVLDSIEWKPDGWPTVNSGAGPSGDTEAALPPPYDEDFHSAPLDPEWKWPVGHPTTFRVTDGRLILDAGASVRPAFLAHSLPSLLYVAEVAVPADATAASGLGLVGETTRQMTLFRRGPDVFLQSLHDGRTEQLAHADVPPTATVWLRLASGANHEATFSYSTDREHWTTLGETSAAAKMLAWDRGFRLALAAQGDPGTHAAFEHFSLRSVHTTEPATPSVQNSAP